MCTGFGLGVFFDVLEASEHNFQSMFAQCTRKVCRLCNHVHVYRFICTWIYRDFFGGTLIIR